MRPELRLDLSLLALRLVTAAVFLFHGGAKLFGLFGGPGLAGFAGYLESLGLPLPMASALLAASAEFLGGLALLTGVGQRLAAPFLVATMLVAALTAHSGFDVTAGGMEYTLVLAVLSAALGLLGPGRFVLRRAAASRPAPLGTSAS